MRHKILVLIILFSSFSATVGYSVTTDWTGNGDPSDWFDALNWSGGVPTSTTVANLVYPAGTAFDININSDASAQGLVFGADLDYGTQLLSGSGVFLTIGNAGITNSSAGFQIYYEAATIMGASSTFSAGSLGLVVDKSLNVQANTLTVATSAGTLILQGGTTFSVSSPLTYGKVAGTGSVQLSGALTFDFTSAVGIGTWDFFSQTPTGALTSVALANSYAGAFTETTPGNWDATAGGLNWNYQASTGILTSVIPEPATWALLVGGLTTVMVIRRRKRA